MPQQTDSARPTRLASVDDSLVGQKLRLAGRMLSYDASTGFVLLLDQDVAVLVDASLCLDPWSSSWARERLCTIMAIGHVERSSEDLPIPVIPAYAPPPIIDPRIAFRALLVLQAPDLDMELWNLAILEGEH